jgi:hypothetical protein
MNAVNNPSPALQAGTFAKTAHRAVSKRSALSFSAEQMRKKHQNTLNPFKELT